MWSNKKWSQRIVNNIFIHKHRLFVMKENLINETRKFSYRSKHRTKKKNRAKQQFLITTDNTRTMNKRDHCIQTRLTRSINESIPTKQKQLVPTDPKPLQTS